MLKSMTGYGRGEAERNGCSFVVEVRSVNNRYLDCNVRLPRVYTCAESGVVSKVKSAISRGKVDVFVTVEHTSEEAVSVTVNQPVAAGYLNALKSMSDTYGIDGTVSVSLLSRFPDVFRVEKAEEDLDQLSSDLLEVVDLALQDFDTMRSREGIKLEEDLLSRLETLERYTGEVEIRSPKTVEEYRARLTDRIREVLADQQIDESRILTEAAIYADKIAVAEETVRLRSHIAQFRTMVAGKDPIGRKLDFLIQEMNRETNTMGSKCNDLEISTIVVDMKAEIEKIREQVQNVE